MIKNIQWLRLAGFFLLLIAPLTGQAAILSIAKDDFSLSPTGLGQGHASVAMLKNGSSIMVWQEQGTQGLIIDSYGSTVANLAISRPSGSASHPIVAAGSNRFVVTWQALTAYGHEVFISIFDASGHALLPATSLTQGDVNVMSETVIHPDVSMNNMGEFIVAWDVINSGVRTVLSQSFTRQGQSTSSIIALSTRPSAVLDPASKAELGFPDIDLNSHGDVVVAWSGYDVLTSSYPVVFRQFNINDSIWVLGDEKLLDYVAGSIQVRPMVSINNRGDIATAWMDLTAASMNTGKTFYRKYTKNTSHWEPSIRMAGDLDAGTNRITCYILNSGTTIVAFSGKSLDGSLDVYMSFFNPKNKLLKQTRVNSSSSPTLNFEQRRPAIAFVSQPLSIDLVVTWEMFVPGDRDIVYGKVYHIIRN